MILSRKTKKNLFSTPAPKQSKASQQVSSLKNNCALFARLYISCKSRETASFQEKSSLEVHGQVITTYSQDVRCTSPRETASLSPCTHEEADTRMLLHAADAVQQGDRKILLRTVDTDVLVLAVSVFHDLSSMRPEEQLETWVAFRAGNKSEVYSCTFNRK